MQTLYISVYLIIGISITLGWLAFDDLFRWDIRNIPESFKKLSRGDKLFFLALPFSWFFFAIILAIGLLIT